MRAGAVETAPAVATAPAPAPGAAAAAAAVVVVGAAVRESLDVAANLASSAWV